MSVQLASLDLEVTPRRIERMGVAGLLGEPPYGPGLVKRTVYTLELVERHDLAVLAMFVEGRYRVSERRLKEAYCLALDRLEETIDKRLGPGDRLEAFRAPAATLARRAVKEPEGRELRERLRQLWPGGPGRSISLAA